MNLNKLFYTYMDKDSDGGAPPPSDPPPSDPPPNDPPPSDPPKDPPSDPFYSTMPETWRNELIDGLELDDDDAKEKRLGQLNRFSDLRSMTKSLFDGMDKIREGIKPQVLGENATEDEIKEYREAHGVPEKAEDYNTSLDEGLVLGEEDERIMSEVYKVAHENNISSDAIGKLTNAMLSARQIEEDAITSQDGVDKQTADRQIRDAWGNDYKTNIGMVNGLVSLLPESVKEDFENARLADGTALFNSPEFLVFMSDMARKVNPAGSVVPNSANPTRAITDEISTLEKRMGDDDWFKDEAAQKRLRDLYDAQENMGKIK